MLWWASRIQRAHDRLPRTCNVLFHAPQSLLVECDCEVFCKWPPRGGTPDALPLVIVAPDHEAEAVAGVAALTGPIASGHVKGSGTLPFLHARERVWDAAPPLPAPSPEEKRLGWW